MDRQILISTILVLALGFGALGYALLERRGGPVSDNALGVAAERN